MRHMNLDTNSSLAAVLVVFGDVFIATWSGFQATDFTVLAKTLHNGMFKIEGTQYSIFHLVSSFARPIRRH